MFTSDIAYSLARFFLFRELEIARRKKRWRIKEAQLRAERNRGVDSKGHNGVAANSSQASFCDVPPDGAPVTATADEDKTLQQLYHDPTMKSRQPKQVSFVKNCLELLI